MIQNIVFAVPSPRRDTPERMSFVKLLARGISDLGTAVHLFPVVKSVNPFEFLRQGLALRRLIRRLNPAIVVAQYGTYTGLLVALCSRRPIIITYRGSDLNPEFGANPLLLAAQHAASQLAAVFADGIVCVTRELADRVMVNRRREVIPSPTDLDLFRPMDQLECRRKLGWAQERPTAVFIAGRDAVLKGIALARDVRDELIRRNSPVDLQMVEREIPLADVPVYLNAADCMVFLSRFEGSPNIIRDACACNLPIVTTLSGDIAEVLRDVVPGRIVSYRIDEVADAIEEVAGMGVRSNGRERMKQYATAAIARRTLSFYEAIVADSQPEGRR